MTSNPRVGIVVLNWNRRDDTLACLATLEELAYDNAFIVVVDNASTDDSVVAINMKRPDVTLLREEFNGGYASGNNRGMRHALERGADFVWLLNNDATANTTSLSELVTVAASDESVGAVGSVVFEQTERDRIQVWGGGYINAWTGSAGLFTMSVESARLSYISGVSMLIRASALQAVGMFDTEFFMYWEDADLGLRLRRGGWKLAVAPKSFVWHKGSASTGGPDNVNAYRLYAASSIRYFRLHAPVPSVPITIRFLGGALKWSLRGDWERLRALMRRDDEER